MIIIKIRHMRCVLFLSIYFTNILQKRVIVVVVLAWELLTVTFMASNKFKVTNFVNLSITSLKKVEFEFEMVYCFY